MLCVEVALYLYLDGYVASVLYLEPDATRFVPAAYTSMFVESMVVGPEVHHLRLDNDVGNITQVEFDVFIDRDVLEAGLTLVGEMLLGIDIAVDLQRAAWYRGLSELVLLVVLETEESDHTFAVSLLLELVEINHRHVGNIKARQPLRLAGRYGFGALYGVEEILTETFLLDLLLLVEGSSTTNCEGDLPCAP